MLLRDIRYALRLLRRSPLFAGAAVAVLALGIGATTAVYTVVRAVILRPLPYRQPDRLVTVRADAPGVPRQPSVTGREFHALRARTDLFEDVASVNGVNANLTDGEAMERVAGGSATDNFLPILGVAPLVGRPLSVRDDIGEPYVRSILISYELWQRHWNGDRAIVGRPTSVNNLDVTIVGVMPKGFRTDFGPDANVAPNIDIWFPNTIGQDDRSRSHPVVARLRAGVSLRAAQDAIDQANLGTVRLTLTPLADDVVRGVRPALLAFAACVGVVMLVAGANLMNLLLARGVARSREIAVRTAIGASRFGIIRQLLVESLILGVLGGGLGLLIGSAGVRALLWFAPAALPRRDAIHIDLSVALFAFGMGMLAAIVIGVVPAFQAARGDIAGALKGDVSGPPQTATVRGVLIASQLAFSVLLLVGAGLMGRTFLTLRDVPLGFDPIDVLTLKLELSFRAFPTAGERLAFYSQAREGVRALPGVSDVSLATPVPLDGVTIYQRVAAAPDAPEIVTASTTAFSGYFALMRMAIHSGREFRAEDDAPGAPARVIVDDRLATQLWPGGTALGQRVLLSPSGRTPKWAEVIGVAAHTRTANLRQDGLPQIYLPYNLQPYSVSFVVRSNGNAAALAPAVTQAIQRLRPGRPVFAVRTLASLVDDASADSRFALFVLTVFAAIAVLLTAVGVYGVVAYATARRRREIAVRLALGADAGRIVRLVVREGAAWTIAGLGAGVAGALALSRYLSALLFNVGARDPLTFAAVVAVLGAIALAATAIPAIRAVRVDPMLALRSE